MRKELIAINLLFFLFATIETKAQTSLNFDGIDDEVDFGNSSVFMQTNEFTIEVYIQQSTIKYWPAFASNFQDSSGYWKGYWLGGDTLGHAVFYIGETSDSGSGYWVTSTSVIADGNWHHIAGVFENDSAKIYVDGTIENTLHIPTFNLSSTENFRIGNDVWNEVFQGKIDDVRLWSIARSPSEILMYKDSCLNVNENNLIAYYHFENGTNNSTVYDLTANGNHGTLNNMDPATCWVLGLNCTINVGVLENGLDGLLIVYPNPTTGYLSIDLGDTFENITISVKNVSGQLVSKYEFHSTNRLYVEIVGETGFYLIEINTKQERLAVIKVMKK